MSVVTGCSQFNPMGLLKEDPSVVMEQNARSFFFASQVFSAEKLKQVALLYSFCRFVDDCADEAPVEERLHWVQEIEKHLRTNQASPWPDFDQKVKEICAIGVQREDLITLVEGALFDLQDGVICTDDDLLLYCYQVAGVVGLMMCPLIGVVDPVALPHAVHMGIAMQMTNIARDIYADYDQDRVYLPLSWRRSVKPVSLGKEREKIQDNVSRETSKSVNNVIWPLNDLAQKDNLCRLLEMSEVYYKSGRSGLAAIPFRPRLTILIASEVYRAIGLKIIKNNFNIKNRTYLGTVEKLWVSLKALRYLFTFSFWQFRQPQLHKPMETQVSLYQPKGTI